VTRTPRFARPSWLAAAGPAVLLGVVMASLTACATGPIGANTPLSSSQSFVGASYNSEFFQPGSRSAAPDFTGTTLTGQKFRLSDDRGNVVVLNFWGSWCAPCRAEAPALAALARHFGHDPVRFLGDDVRDSTVAARAFEHTFNVSYPSLNDPGEQVALAFNSTVPATAIPSTLVIDRAGRIAARVVGAVSYYGLRDLITKVMAGQT
jgi:peroxiredoxin